MEVNQEDDLEVVEVDQADDLEAVEVNQADDLEAVEVDQAENFQQNVQGPPSQEDIFADVQAPASQAASLAALNDEKRRLEYQVKQAEAELLKS